MYTPSKHQKIFLCFRGDLDKQYQDAKVKTCSLNVKCSSILIPSNFLSLSQFLARSLLAKKHQCFSQYWVSDTEVLNA